MPWWCFIDQYGFKLVSLAWITWHFCYQLSRGIWNQRQSLRIPRSLLALTCLQLWGRKSRPWRATCRIRPPDRATLRNWRNLIDLSIDRSWNRSKYLFRKWDQTVFMWPEKSLYAPLIYYFWRTLLVLLIMAFIPIMRGAWIFKWFELRAMLLAHCESAKSLSKPCTIVQHIFMFCFFACLCNVSSNGHAKLLCFENPNMTTLWWNNKARTQFSTKTFLCDLAQEQDFSRVPNL